MTSLKSGSSPYTFTHRSDLHVLPSSTTDFETKLHGGFAADKRDGYGHLYYGMPGCGVLRISPDLTKQDLILLPDHLRPLNFHSTKLGQIGGEWRLFLPANEGAMVAVVDLEGELDFSLPKPEFDAYLSSEVSFAPTDTVLVGESLFVADGYGANYISTADVSQRKWVDIFGGAAGDPAENGKFTTAHGISVHPEHPNHLVIADRPSARLQVHDTAGAFVASHALPEGAWPCGVDTLSWDGRLLAVIGSLVDPVKDRPAPIYILDFRSFEVLSTIRPKEELGIDLAQHIHNVIFHVHQGQLYLVCQSWNPGHYFVLEQV
jgi:hypothetical protein